MPDRVLTEQERTFIEENLSLLYKFSAHYRIGEEYNSRLALRFTRVAVSYLSNADLQKYRFSTIAWMHLRSELSHILRENLQEPPMTSLDVVGDLAYHDSHEGLLWSQIEQQLTERQKQVLQLRIDGKSNIEIAEECGIGLKAVERLFWRIRKRLEGFFNTS